MSRRKFSWTDLQIHRLDQVQGVVNSLKNYWPLSIRQIHYQLFSHMVEWGGRRDITTYPNTSSGQGDLIKVAKWGRIHNHIPWEAIDDSVREKYKPYKFADLQDYVKNELRYILNDYQRCLVQDQEYYVEVWVEKHALFKIIKNVAQKYCVPVVACRGYDSITYLRDFYIVASEALYNDKEPVVLYFGDLDPSGMDMFQQSIYTLEYEMGLVGAVHYVRIALGPDQVEKYNLPNDPNAGKYRDRRYKQYIEEYGQVFVELDALHPIILEGMVSEAIEKYTDMEAFDEQKEVAELDNIRLDRVRGKIVNVINAEFGTQLSI